MYVNNIEPEMFLPPGSESFNHNATHTTSSRSRSNKVNNNIVPVYIFYSHYNTVWIANTEIVLDPNNSVIKRLRCRCYCQNATRVKLSLS